MSEIDVLSLSITASTKQAEDKINSLIRTLKGLDTAFRSLTGSTTYANNLETAVHAITRVNNAIANINSDKMASVAKSMRELGRAGSILSNFGNIDKTGQAMDNVSSKATNLASNLSKMFNIKDKNAISELTESIQKMIDTMGRGDAYYQAESNVQRIIEEFSRFDNQLGDTLNTYNKVREKLRQNPLYIPENFSSEADWLKNKATIGITNTTSDITKGVSAGQLKAELEGLIPALQGLSNESDIINTIADWLRNNATPAMVDFNTAVEQGSVPVNAASDAVKELAQSLGVIMPTAQQTADALNSIDWSKFADADDMWIAETEAIQQLRDQLQPVITDIDRLAESNQKISNTQPFETIVSGLESLQGVTIGDFSNITTLAEGVNKLGYQSAVTAAQILPQIADGLRDFNFNLPEMTGMEEFAKGLRSLGSKAVQNAASSLPFVADGLKQLSSIKLPDMANLTEFAKALSIFGRQTSEKAIKNIPQLAVAFEQLFKALSKAPSISRNTIDAANAMANLASKTGGVTRALNNANPSLTSWSKNAGHASRSTFSLASAIGKVYASYWLLFRAFGQIKKSIDIASDLTEVKNVVVHAFDDMAYKANQFSSVAGELFGMSKLQSLNAASRYQAMGKTMGITNNMVIKANDKLRDSLKDTLSLDYVQKAYGDLGNTAADMSINLAKLAGDLASLYNTDIDVAAEKLNSIFTGTTKPLREFGFDLTQATLQEWALTNGINANIKSMTQAEKAVLRYEYVMANAGFVLGDFVRTADSWHNTIVRLKLAFQNLGSVIGQGFINLLKPVIQRVTAFINTLTGLIQKGINAIGKLLGWQIEIDPVAPMTDGSGAAEDLSDAMEDTEDASGGTADNMNKSAKAAKKMKDYLLGIDELNVFRPNEDNDSGKNKTSGGGANGGATGGGANGGATGGGVDFKKYTSDISSWFQLGSKISEALSNALESIDWDSIYKKANKFGIGLASFLNGLITPRLFYNLGKTIANSLNTALHFLDSFGTHFNWKNFGASIAAGINGFFENFDFKLLAKTFNTWALGLLTALITALKKTKWEMIGSKIGEFLVNVQWLKIGKKVAGAIWAAINAAFQTLKGMFKTAPLETAILGVVAVIGLLKSNVVAAAIKSLSGLSNAFSVFFYYAKQEGVISGLSMAFPKLGNALEVARSGMIAFDAAFTSGQGVFKSLSAGFGEISANISPLGKLFLTAAGGLVEFLTVSDGMKNIYKESQNLITSLAEITTGVGVAAAAFTLAFGFPAGIVITAIVGVISAMKGVNDAINEIKVEDFGEKVKNALVNPGGVPLEEVIGSTIDSLDEMGDEFETLANKSDDLNKVDGNIRDIQSEITLLEHQLSAGVITQEEYTQGISDAYDRMAAAIKTKIGQAELYISGALGEGGSISEALKQQGVDTQKLVDDTILSGDDLLQKATTITQKLATLDPNSPEYANLKKELYNLAIQADNTDKAAQALETSLQKPLDWEKFIDEEGALKTENIKGILGEVANKADEVKTNAENSMNGVVIALKNAGNEAGAEEVQNAIPGALESINGKVSEKCTNLSDTIQQDAIDNITTIIEDAGKNWESMDDWEKAIYDYSKSNYQKQAATSYKTNVIDPLSQTISSEYEALGVDGAGWAEAASAEIMNGIFSEEAITNEDGWTTYRTTLSDTWKDAIDQGSELTYDTAVDSGEYIAMGIGEGMKKANTDTPISDFFRNLWKSFSSIFKSNSPAKAMYPMGNNIMMGIIEGFSEKYSAITKAISDWFDKYVKPWFTIDKWATLGENIKTGIVKKWDEFKTIWISKITDWWNNNVKPWFTIEKWNEQAQRIKEAIITKFGEMVTQWGIDISNWWTTNVEPWFSLQKWLTLADNLVKGIITKLSEMVTQWNTAITDWWTKYVEPYFDLTKWQGLAENIKKAIIDAIEKTITEWGQKVQGLIDEFEKVFKESTFKEIGSKCMSAVLDGFKSGWESVVSWVNEKVNWLKDKFTIKVTTKNEDSSTQQPTTPKKATKKATGGIFDDGRWRNIHAYGMGGMPDEGQLFWAREKGAELVGQIGGNTAVMNNDQIVASVASGVQQAVTEALSPYLSDISTNTRITASKDFTVQIGDRQIAEASNRGQRQLGAVLFT